MKKLLTIALSIVCLSTLVACSQEQAHKHTLVHHDELAASCTEEGRGEHWSCDECEKLFADESASIELTEQDLTIARVEHTNNGLICDDCGTLCVTAERLQSYLDTALGLEGATVSEYYWPTASDSEYAIGEIATKFDLSIVSGFELSECFVGTFANREVIRYKNESGTMVGLVLDDTAQHIEGVLIYDENNNLISQLVINE